MPETGSVQMGINGHTFTLGQRVTIFSAQASQSKMASWDRKIGMGRMGWEAWDGEIGMGEWDGGMGWDGMNGMGEWDGENGMGEWDGGMG